MMDWFSGPMEIRRVPVRPVRLKLLCPHCKTGFLEYAGSLWPTTTPGFHHRCNSCGFLTAVSGQQFPRIEFEEDE